MKNLRSWQWGIIFVIALHLLIFRKFFFQGLLPIPYNIMVGWYFPFNVGGWSEYHPGIVYKGGLFAADVFRQMIPWKNLSLEIIRAGEVPLWNPYNFSGEPLLANIQTTVLYPLSLFFLLFENFDLVWSGYIIASPVIAMLGMWLFFKSLAKSDFAGLIAGIAFAWSGHMTSWLEWGVVTHSAIWLPWILFSLQKFFVDGKKWAGGLLIFSVYATLTGGYPQESAYSLLFASVYGIYLLSRQRQNLKLNLLKTFLLAGITLVLVSPQLVPTFQLYQHSALKGETSQDLYLRTGLDLRHTLSLFAPDFFGNRITENYWADTFTEVDYTDANLFIGTVPLLFVLIGLLRKKFQPEEKLFWLIVIVSFLLSLKTPLSPVIASLRIPMLSTGVAAGILFVTVSSLSILSGFGAEALNKKKVSISYWLVPLNIYMILVISWLFVPAEFRRTAVRNSVLPLASIAAGTTLVAFIWAVKFFKLKQLKSILFLVPALLLVLAGLETTIYAHKILSFSQKEYSYPEHVALDSLREFAGYNRIVGFYEAEIPTDLHTQYKLFSTEGYNPLHYRPYQELVAGSKYEGFPDEIQRSDAILDVSNPETRNRFMQLTSTKYVLAKVTNPKEDWEVQVLKYDPDNFELIWQLGLFKIYQFSPTIERVTLYNDYEVISEAEERVDRLYSQEFNPEDQVILESEPSRSINPDASGSASILNYQENSVTIEATVSNGPALLLLNDSYYPSWKAYIDGEETQIYRANHSFRVVVVPDGVHEIQFRIGIL